MTDMNKRFAHDQRGIVSIVVTMIIMILLSLIVIGFAQVSRREQRQGLDRQLASQANYAAESGINDVVAYLKSGGALSATANSACNTYTDTNSTYRDQTINGNVVSTCVLVDNSVENLEYQGVTANEEVVFPLRMATQPTVNTITIAWHDDGRTSSDPTSCGTDLNLPALESWNCPPAGALRIDMTPLTPGNASRQQITQDTIGVLIKPVDNPTIPIHPVSNGLVRGASCDANRTPRVCEVVLNVPDAASYYVRVRPIYKTANLHIRANGGQRLSGAQAFVDSTGRANDVLKRLVARVPICENGLACGKRPNPGFAIHSADTLCKLYGVIPAPANQVLVNDADPNCQTD